MGIFGAIGLAVKYLPILMKISGYLPAIINIFRSVEALITSPGSGKEKLEAAKDILKKLLTYFGEPEEDQEEILGAVPVLAESIVGTLNKTGEFHKSGAPPSEAKP